MKVRTGTLKGRGSIAFSFISYFSFSFFLFNLSGLRCLKLSKSLGSHSSYITFKFTQHFDFHLLAPVVLMSPLFKNNIQFNILVFLLLLSFSKHFKHTPSSPSVWVSDTRRDIIIFIFFLNNRHKHQFLSDVYSFFKACYYNNTTIVSRLFNL